MSATDAKNLELSWESIFNYCIRGSNVDDQRVIVLLFQWVPCYPRFNGFHVKECTGGEGSFILTKELTHVKTPPILRLEEYSIMAISQAYF